MKKFALPEGLLDSNWEFKHDLVKTFVKKFKDVKKLEIGYKHGLPFWNTDFVLELLNLLNLQSHNSNYEFIKDVTPFDVTCSIHNEVFNTSVERLNKGQICKKCLSTERKLTQKEAEDKAANVGYELLAQYKGYHVDHPFKCPRGHEINTTLNIVLQKCCPECGEEEKRKKLRCPYRDIEELFKNLKLEHPKIELLTTESEYEAFKGESRYFNIRYTCHVCGEPKKNTLMDIKAKHLMCNDCYGEKVNAERRLTYLEVATRLNDKDLNIKTSEEQFLLEYKNTLYEVEYSCKECKYEGPKRVADIATSGCARCNQNYYGKTNHKIQKWADQVKEDFHNICINCGYTGPLEAHHIYDRKYFPLFEDELWNGLAICGYCHRLNKHCYHKFVKYKGYAFSRPKVFIEWLEEWGEKCRFESHRSFYDSAIPDSIKNLNEILKAI